MLGILIAPLSEIKSCAVVLSFYIKIMKQRFKAQNQKNMFSGFLFRAN